MGTIPERLNYEIRDSRGNIVAATVDRGIAETIHRMGIIPRSEIWECQFATSHKAWFPCDFSKYFDNYHPRPDVMIEDTVYTAQKTELEV